MNPTNLPGQVVNAQDIDVNALIDEITTPPGQDPAKPAPVGGTVKLNLGGQVREFPDAGKAQEALQLYANEVAKRQAELEAAARDAGAVGGGQLTTGQDDPTAPDLAPRVDMEKFAALVKAGRLDQAFDYTDRVRYGGVSPKEVLHALAAKVQQQDQTLQALMFTSQHAELGNQDDAAKVGAVMRQMGIPRTTQGFELALAYAKQHGLIADGRREPGGEAAGPPPTGNSPAPPPSPGRRQASGGDGAPNWLDRAEDMNPEQLRDLINRLESQRTA